jgi:methionyl-tRNA formyltransferase
MKLVFFGSPNAAVRSLKKILEKGHHVELVITQPDRPAGRRKRTAQSPVKNFSLERNIPVYQPEKIRKDPIALEKIKKIDPELNVVVAYGQIIPKSILASAKIQRSFSCTVGSSEWRAEDRHNHF